jgi:thiol:disulfide interchange protein DsbD
MHTVKQLFGILMLAMAVWMLSRIASHTVVMWLSSALLFVAAGLIFRIIPHKLFKIRRSRKTLFIVAVLIILTAVALTSAMNILRPGVRSLAAGQTDQPVIVRSQAQLNQALAAAKLAQKPVLVDFYADWCESCKDMEENILQQAEIQLMLKKFTVIRADLSDNSADEQNMMQANNIIAPPTFLFFTRTANPLPQQTLVGETDLSTFKARLNDVLIQVSG